MKSTLGVNQFKVVPLLSYGLISLFILTSLFFGFRAWVYVGYFNDDATYITTALTLLKGSYWDMSSVKNHALTQFWPGYSLALTPWVAMFRPHWEYLRLFSIGLTAISCMLLASIGSLYLKNIALLCLLIVFAFHPLTITNSVNVMSEPLFLALALAYFLILNRQLEVPDGKRAGILVALLVWVGWVRPIGIVLCISTIVAFVSVRRWREGLVIVSVALPLWLLFPLWVLKATQQPPAYYSLWHSTAPIFAHHVLDHGYRFCYLLLGQNVLGLRLPHSERFMPFSAGSIIFSLLICGFGLNKMLVQFPEKRGLTWAMTVFVLIYVGIHLHYLSIDERYFWPVLPVLFLIWISAFLPKKEGNTQTKIVGALTVLWIINLCWPDISLMTAAWQRTTAQRYRLPRETFAWIRTHLPSDALLLGRQPVIYLYTGLRGLGRVECDDEEGFLYTLNEYHLSFAVFLPDKPSMPLVPHGQNIAEHLLLIRQYIAQMPHVFVPIYSNLQEQTVIFQIRQNPFFEQSYALYRRGSDDLRKGQWILAEKEFRESLKLFPNMGSTWTAYGILAYMQRNYAIAERRLTRALQIQSGNILANLHMARIQRLFHRSKSALDFYKRTEHLIEESGTYLNLLPDVHAEMLAIKTTPEGHNVIDYRPGLLEYQR